VPKFDFGDFVFVVLLLLALFAGGGGGIGGGSPVFPTTKRAVAVIHESSERGKLTAGQLAVINGVVFRETVEKSGVVLRVVDLDNPAATDEAWVAAALKVERKSTPWIVGSGPKSGISAPLPATATSAEALKLIEGIK